MNVNFIFFIYCKSKYLKDEKTNYTTFNAYLFFFS